MGAPKLQQTLVVEIENILVRDGEPRVLGGAGAGGDGEAARVQEHGVDGAARVGREVDEPVARVAVDAGAGVLAAGRRRRRGELACRVREG